MGVVRNNGKPIFVRNRIKGDAQPSTAAASPMRPMVPQSDVQFAENENFSTGSGPVVEKPNTDVVEPNTAAIENVGGRTVEPLATEAGAVAAEGAAAPAATNAVQQGAANANGGVDTSKLDALQRQTLQDKQNENQALREMNNVEPNLVDLYGLSPEEAKRAMATMKSESLEQAIENDRWALETPEEKEKREKKERLNRNLAGALSMIGALGNYASAAYSTDGRSVPVGEFSSAEGKAQDEKYKQREAALGRLREAGRRKSEILNQGYKNARERDKEKKEEERWQKQFEETKRAKQAAEALQASNQALKAQTQQFNQQNAVDKANEAKRHNLATEAIGRTRNEVAKIAANNKSNGGGRGSNSTKVFKIDGNTYNVPTNVWNSVGIAQLSTFLPEAYRNRLKPDRFGKTENVETVIGEYTKDVESHNADPTAWSDFINWMNTLAGAAEPEEEPNRSFDEDEEDEDEDNDA